MIANQVADFFNNKFGLVKSTNLFVGLRPESPNNLVCIYDTPAPAIAESSCLAIDEVEIQILVRHIDYNQASVTCWNLYYQLIGFGGKSLVDDGNIISYITPSQPPNSIGKDDNNRNEWIVNLFVRFEPLQVNNFRL
jgi:hypothetical protein